MWCLMCRNYLIYLGWIPRNFNFHLNSILKSINCHFWGKIMKMITRVNFRNFTNHAIYDFRDFLENDHSAHLENDKYWKRAFPKKVISNDSFGTFRKSKFSWRFFKSYIGWSCEKPRFHPWHHCLRFSLKKWQFRLENHFF